MTAAQHPCADCGRETANVYLCGDCDVEALVANLSCRECSVWLIRDDIGGPLEKQHAPTCSLKTVADCYPEPRRTNA